jgi:hypothetical protein
MWKFNSPFIDFSKYLKKSRLKATAPNKIVIAICWIFVGVALMVAFLKIVFRVF